MKARFTGKKQQSDDVWSFRFAPVEAFAWQAGQSVRLEIAGPYGPLEHRFSIASPPSSREVVITTRLSDSDYKESLANMPLGSEVDLQGLEGSFVWRDAELPHIFVAAGIGITPFHAIIAERIAQNLDVPATLLYSSRDEPVVYGEQIEQWYKNSPALRRALQKDRITATQVLALPQAHGRLIYISGPSKMVGALYADLVAAGITPAQVLQDHFTGRVNEDGLHPQM